MSTLSQLKFPILQAPIGSIANPVLAAAVCEAGGMGSLALAWASPASAAKQIQALQALTSEAFFVNFVLAFEARALDTALELKVPLITLSWGCSKKLIQKIHAKGAEVGVQIGSVEGARVALECGADFLICQGEEAGGHVQSSTPLTRLLQGVKAIKPGVDIVAAGGLSDSEDIKQALTRGASAVMLGTRFVASVESNAHEAYKQALVSARREDSVATLCFDGNWPYAMHRVLKNPTLDNWEASGCPPKGQRPGEGDITTELPNGIKINRYSEVPPSSQMQGKILDCCLYAGTSCAKINNIPSAGDLVRELARAFKTT